MPMATLLAAGDHAEVTRRHRRRGPDRRTSRRWPTPASTWTTSPTSCCARASTKFVEPMDKLLEGIERQARGDRHPRPPTIDASTARRRSSRAIAERVEQADGRGRRPAHLAQGRHALGPGRPARGRQPPRLADRHRARCARSSTTCRPSPQAVRDEGVKDVVLLGMGGSSLAPEVIRRSFGEQDGWPRLHVLDSTDAGAVRGVRGRASTSTTTLFLVSTKSGGTIETLSLFKHFWSLRPDGSAFVAITDPGSGLEKLAARARLPAHLPQRPRHRRALQRAVVLRARARGAHGRRRRGLLRRAPASPSRTARRFDSGDVSTAGCGSGSRGASWRAPGRDKLTYVIDPPLQSLRPVGRAAHRRVDRQAGQGHPAGRRRAARRRPTSTATTAPSCTCATSTSPTRRPTPRSRRCARPATRSIVREIARPDRPRADLLLRRVRDRRRRLGAGDQPVRPAQRAGGQGRHQPRARPRAPRTSPTPTDDELRALLGGLGAPQLPRGHGLRRAVRGLRRRGERAARRRSATRRSRRRRSATGRASCTRPASCTRAARRPGASCSSSTTPSPTSRSPAPTTRFTRLKHAQAIGDLETLRAHDLPAAAGDARGRRSGRGAARADRAPEGAAVSAGRAERADEPARRGARAPARSTRRRSSSSAPPATWPSASCCRRSTTSPTRARCPSASTSSASRAASMPHEEFREMAQRGDRAVLAARRPTTTVLDAAARERPLRAGHVRRRRRSTTTLEQDARRVRRGRRRSG